MAEQTTSVERKEDFGTDGAAVVARWLAEIKAYDSTFGKWADRSRKIVKRYRDDRDSENDESRRFNVLWSNVQTLQPALYSQLPTPDVRRRYKDRDPVGRTAAIVLERCLGYSIDTYDFNASAKAVRDDYLLTGRGTAWVRYVPSYGEETRDRTFLQAVDGIYQDEGGTPYPEPMFDEAGEAFVEGEPYRPVLYEEALCDHIAWEDFGHTPAPKWEKVTAVWKRELLTREQLVERFGEKGKEASMQKKVAGVSDETAKAFGDAFSRGEVYEIWDKSAKKVYWISPGYTQDVLDSKDDPLGLEGFFPCPRPLYGTTTTDSLIPVPDFVQYQSQAIELDTLTQRIALLTKALKIGGVYNSEIANLERIVTATDNTMVPVDSWAMFAEKGGLTGQMDFLPIKEIAEVTLSLVSARERVKTDLYELTGLSDIVRGQSSSGSDPTATEQRIKGQWASIRLQDRQDEMARFVRDILRLKAEIMAEQFEPETLAEMSGWMQSQEAEQIDRKWEEVENLRRQAIMAAQTGQIDPSAPPPVPPEPVPNAAQVFAQAIELLRDDRLRTFRIDIETLSTVSEDSEAEKRNRTEFLTAVSGFMQNAIPAAEQNPELRPLLSEMLLFGVRGFKTGRQLEAVLEETLENLSAKPEQKEDPNAGVETAKLEMEGQKMQADAAHKAAQIQIEQQKLALEEKRGMGDANYKAAQMQAEEAERQRRHELEMERLRIDGLLAQAKFAEMTNTQAAEAEKIAIERDKLMDGQAAREEQRQHAFRERELDGRMVTPPMEEEMKEFAEAFARLADGLAQQSQSNTEAIARQEKMIEALMTSMTAPKRVVRDEKGQIVGSETVLN